ncbi:ectonucleotide pyrophosphatase/phosphodiesterase [Sphingomonas sp.]|jgi:predicted AlkP superfamily pyrophosphatase or phosphodiesterase|uniref:alkaline phosphatase family protein n=1 Tax=Sphingomonas sp. TaxID=28214 RepID=UPI002EDB7551
MRWTPKLAAAALAAVLQACAGGPVSAPAPIAAVETKAPVTILVSIDGFRPDYLERGVTPNLSGLAAKGLAAPMRPSFPSKTFPNHWTLVTGLRPDRHGITANKMEDPARPDETFTMSTDDPFWWNAADPIWVDAEKAGVRTATMFWPGSNVAVGGERAKDWPNPITGGARPRDWAQFNMIIDNGQRVNGVLDWLRRPARIRPAFLTVYFDTVDTAGHDFGPGDPRTTQAVADIDKHIGDLLAGLAELGQPANLVIVADHGMAATSSDRTIVLSQLLPAGSYRSVETGPYAGLFALPGHEAGVEKALFGERSHYHCWRKSEIPARLHYGSHPRIPPILCLAEVGWQFAEKPPTARKEGGNHGWDNAAPEMAALFIASGPAFRPGKLPAFDNVHVYPLLRDLLGLPVARGKDGDGAVFKGVMTP